LLSFVAQELEVSFAGRESAIATVVRARGAPFNILDVRGVPYNILDVAHQLITQEKLVLLQQQLFRQKEASTIEKSQQCVEPMGATQVVQADPGRAVSVTNSSGGTAHGSQGADASKHRLRAEELGVSPQALHQLCLPLIKAGGQAPGVIRLLQWNILADGLSDDGFLVCDYLIARHSVGPMLIGANHSALHLCVDRRQSTVYILRVSLTACVARAGEVNTPRIQH
jgi:hypothetical protein